MSSNNGNGNGNGNGDTERKRKRRWGETSTSTSSHQTDPSPSTDPSPPPPPPPAVATVAVVDGKAKALALQDSIRARLAALKGKTKTKTAAAKQTTKGNNNSSNSSSSVVSIQQQQQQQQQQQKRAKHYELDLTVTAPTFHEKLIPTKPKINPYLIHRQDVAAAAAKEDAATSAATTTTTTNATTDEPPPPKTTATATEADYIDDRLERAIKIRKRHKALTFVEPGTFVEIAERKRLKAANAAHSGFASGRKAGTYFQSSTIMANIYGTTEVSDNNDCLAPRLNDKTMTTPYILEWWDLELLPTKLKKQVAAYEGKALSHETQSQLQHPFGSSSTGSGTTGTTSTSTTTTTSTYQTPLVLDLQTRCLEHTALVYSKTAALIQHIIPIQPPNHTTPKTTIEPTLYLTKRERKRQRKLRRQETQRELQDLQAAGLVEPPEPRLTLSNFIRVLGDQAFVDPSQMEQRVMEQIQARQSAHLARNQKNKLTLVQKKLKAANKRYEDTSQQVHVALFYVKDMSHPYHRTKVDLNAQQYSITGGVVECTENPQISCVICEGGPKAIKRYTRLMTVRMKWKGTMMDDEDEDEDDDDDDPEEEEDGVIRHKFNPDNKCALVWTGMTTKRFFKGFVFQACETSDQAKAILRPKGVGQYWDQVLAHASGRGETIPLKLGNMGNNDNDNDSSDHSGGNSDHDHDHDDGYDEPTPDDNEDEDLVMQEA